MKLRRIIITGAPGCGKSTLLIELGKRGFQVMPETYRWLKVIQAIETHSSIMEPGPLSDDQFLLHLGLQRFIDDQPSSQTDYCFYDRSLIDVLAYCRVYDQNARLELCWNVAHSISKYIFCSFLMPILDDIQPDKLRKEDIIEAQRLHSVIEDTYNQCGIHLIKLKNTNTTKYSDQVVNCLKHMEKNIKDEQQFL